MAAIYQALITLVLSGLTAGKLSDIVTKFIIAIVRKDCLLLTINLQSDDLNILQENIKNPFVVMDTPGNLLMDTKCLFAISDGTSLTNIQLSRLSRYWHEIMDKEIYIFLDYGTSLPDAVLVDNVNYVMQYSEGHFHQYIKCPDQQFRLVRIWQDHDVSSTFYSQHCNRKSMHGQALNISYGLIHPATYLNKNGELSGVDVAIVNLAAKYLNFIPHFKQESKWMFFNSETGEAAGILGSVSSKVSHLGIGSITISNIGIQSLQLDFGWPIYQMDLILLATSPKPLKPYWSILRPFSMDVWWLLLSSLCLAMVVVFFLKLVRVSPQKNHCTIELGTLLGQVQVKKRPHQVSSLVFLSLWLIGSGLIHYFYDCNLRAYMMKMEFSKPINSINDILITNTPLFLARGATLVERFQYSGIPSYRALHERIVRENTIYDRRNPQSAHRQIALEGGATIIPGWSTPNALLVLQEKFGPFHVQVGKEPLFNAHGTFVIAKHVQWRDTLCPFLGKVAQAGIVQKEYQKVVSGIWAKIVRWKQDVTPQAFTLAHIAAAFILQGTGIVLSLAMFLSERLRG